MKRFKSKINRLNVPLFIPVWRHFILKTMGNKAFLIYTMGKVGSTTVYKTCKNKKISRLIYHVHFLNDNSIFNIENKYNRNDGKRHSIQLNKVIKGSYSHLDSSYILKELKMEKEFNIITLVRDPVATLFSHVFQNPHIHRPELLNENGEINSVLAKEYIYNSLENNDGNIRYILTWFDVEFFKFTGIDVYRYPFNTDIGHSLIQNKRFKISILSLENIEHNLEFCMKNDFGIKKNIKIINSNVRSKTRNGKKYSDLISQLKIPKASLNKVYSSKFAKHFYSKDQIGKFIGRWSAEKS